MSGYSGPGFNASGATGSTDQTNFDNMNQAVEQLIEDRQQMADDYETLQGELANLIALVQQAQSGQNPDGIMMALMIGMMVIFPQILNYQQDNFSQLADVQNVNSALRAYGTQIENDINAGAASGSASNTANAQDLYDEVTDMQSWVNFLDGSSSNWNTSSWGAAPLDPTDGSNILNSLNDIQSQFGSDWGNTTNMATDLANWEQVPSGSTVTQPSSQASALQNDTSQIAQSVSTMATTVQTNQQFYSNQYNQILGIYSNVLQDESTQVGSFVQNQKTS